jgi:hypothetical protein
MPEYDEAGCDEFSVVVWYANDTHEYIKRYISGKEAVETAIGMTETVGAQTALVTRVITDGGDHTNFLWEYSNGIVYPTREELNAAFSPPPKARPVSQHPAVSAPTNVSARFFNFWRMAKVQRAQPGCSGVDG